MNKLQKMNDFINALNVDSKYTDILESVKHGIRTVMLEGQDYISISSTPYDEDTAQVGEDNYMAKSRKECRAFAHQLLRQFGNPPHGAKLSIKHFPHDAGTYMEVAVIFDDENEIATNYAYSVDNDIPAHWDDEAKKELGLD